MVVNAAWGGGGGAVAPACWSVFFMHRQVNFHTVRGHCSRRRGRRWEEAVENNRWTHRWRKHPHKRQKKRRRWSQQSLIKKSFSFLIKSSIVMALDEHITWFPISQKILLVRKLHNISYLGCKKKYKNIDTSHALFAAGIMGNIWQASFISQTVHYQASGHEAKERKIKTTQERFGNTSRLTPKCSAAAEAPRWKRT